MPKVVSNRMATITIFFKDGGKKVFTDKGYSVFKGKLYIWNPGTRKGVEPHKKYNLSKIKTWEAPK